MHGKKCFTDKEVGQKLFFLSVSQLSRPSSSTWTLTSNSPRGLFHYEKDEKDIVLLLSVPLQHVSFFTMLFNHLWILVSYPSLGENRLNVFSLPNRTNPCWAVRTCRWHLERGVLHILTIEIVLTVPLKKNVTQWLKSCNLQCVFTAQKDSVRDLRAAGVRAVMICDDSKLMLGHMKTGGKSADVSSNFKGRDNWKRVQLIFSMWCFVSPLLPAKGHKCEKEDENIRHKKTMSGIETWHGLCSSLLISFIQSTYKELTMQHTVQI